MNRGSAAGDGLPLWPLGALAVMVTSLIVSLGLPRAVLASDADLFKDVAAEILSGRVPYFDAVYEHLPVALLPTLGVKLVPGSDELFTYALGFGTIMAVGFIGCGFWVGKIGAEAGEPRATMHWLALAGPLLPVVAFRVDVLSLFLVLVAFDGLFVRGRGRGAWAALAATATKAWPVVLAPVVWWAGRKRVAVTLVGFTAVLVGTLFLTPGFREGRGFSGIHLETVTGSFVVWIRSLQGAAGGIKTDAGAVYVEAPVALLFVGPVLAVCLLILTRSMWRHRVSARAAAQLVGVVTFALLLASPLMSAQFLLWLTPWLVFFEDRRIRRLFIGTALLTLALLMHWTPSNFLWQSGLVLRNLLLVGTAAELVTHVRRMQRAPLVSRH